jgi:hypothetical protein
VIGTRSQDIPLVQDDLYSADPVGTLEWLNQTPDPEKLEAAKFGFRHQYFTSKKCRITNRPVLNETDRL